MTDDFDINDVVFQTHVVTAGGPPVPLGLFTDFYAETDCGKDHDSLRGAHVCIPAAPVVVGGEGAMMKQGTNRAGKSTVATADASASAAASSRELRPGQKRTLRDIDRALKRVRRIVYVDFMGSGKTVVLARLIRETIAAGTRVLFLVHRGILLKQAKSQLLAAGLTEAQIGVTWANHAGFNLDAPVQLATVQTLKRREAPKSIGLVIVDEGHHVPMSDYAKVLGWYSDAKIILATATPIHNGKPLHGFADELVLGERVEDLIEEGWLVRPEIWTREDKWLPKGLRKGPKGDIGDKAAARAMSASTIVGGIPRAWKKHAKGLPTLGVAATKDQARDLAAACVKAGITSETIFDEDSEPERDAKLARLRSGETKILWTCNVLGEGWDFDGCRCLIMARPTYSLGYYLQWCGRVMRRGEQSIILDHAGNYVRCGGAPWQDRAWTLDAVPKSTGHRAVVDREGRVTFEPMQVDGKLVRADGVVVQTVCPGAHGMCCPKSKAPPPGAFNPSAVRAREGRPWQCGSCRQIGILWAQWRFRSVVGCVTFNNRVAAGWDPEDAALTLDGRHHAKKWTCIECGDGTTAGSPRCWTCSISARSIGRGNVARVRRLSGYRWYAKLPPRFGSRHVGTFATKREARAALDARIVELESNPLAVIQRERVGRKLNASQVGKIRALLLSGVSRTECAARFHISRTTVYDIGAGRSWKSA